MSKLLLEHIDTLATFDEQRRVLSDAWVLIRDQQIEALGFGPYKGEPVEQRMSLRGYVVLPGLINLHHHFFQVLMRNIPALQNASLFRWLEIMRMLKVMVRNEDLVVATQLCVAELLLSGCTTTVDHNFLKPTFDLDHDTQIQTARRMGIRYHHARGSATLGQPGFVENEANALTDLERLIKTYHDPQPFAMLRVENAPGAPFSNSENFYKASIELARKHGVGNHTHLAQSPEDTQQMLAAFAEKPVVWAERIGWVGPDVWYAHAIAIDEEEQEILSRSRTGISHCPNSNMVTGSGVCQVVPMLKRGRIKIGLGVDGSAANNSSNLLREVRSMLLLQRVFFGADALSPTQALEVAILGGASVLRRDDIGMIAPGKAADIIGVDLNRLAFAGGLHDPLAGMVLCDVEHIDLSIVNGVVKVVNGKLVGQDIDTMIQYGNQLSHALIQRTEKQFNLELGSSIWRKAYPYFQ
jgi:cytosine/adenosine deaminase-related metal-dependent hydrolase